MSLEIIIGVLAGLAVGWAYFEGLWWTVQRVMRDGRRGLLLGSFLVRGLLAAAAAAALGSWSVPALMASAVGFAVARRVNLSRHRGALT